jgi:hypothetical protein
VKNPRLKNETWGTRLLRDHKKKHKWPVPVLQGGPKVDVGYPQFG